MRFSIIVPVYNVEKYLNECIKSILNQTFNNYELILINDGSTDESKKICQLYESNSKVCFIDINNSGVSNARNVGLKQAKGEYVLFVDSDDCLKENALEKIDQELNQDIDLLIFSSEKIYTNAKKEKILKNEFIEKNEALKLLLKNDYFCGYVWNKVFKRKIINNNKLKFNTKIFMNEDLLFCFNYINLLKNKIKTSSNILYEYRVRISSALNSTANEKNVSSILVYKYIFDNCDIQEVNNDAKLYYLRSYYKYKKNRNSFDINLINKIKKELKFKINVSERLKMLIYKFFPQLKTIFIKIIFIFYVPYI